MATPGFGFAEIYVQRKLHKEKMKLAEEVNAHDRFRGSEPETSSGCFLWLSKIQRKKTAQVTDYNDAEPAAYAPNTWSGFRIWSNRVGNDIARFSNVRA